MTIATLLLRENSTTSISTIVEKALKTEPPYLEYELHLINNELDLILTSKNDIIVKQTPTDLILTSNSESRIKSTSTDEGFESDIDSLSIVSSDDSFTSTNIKTNENDSANGSESDTDSKNEETDLKLTHSNQEKDIVKETFDLKYCICYTDVNSRDLLVFVIKNEVLVFKFSNIKALQSFYVKFTALKALNSQTTYNNITAKFNLLQRTDNNGITHIEITRETELLKNQNGGPQSLIELSSDKKGLNEEIFKNKNVNLRQRTESRVILSQENLVNDKVLKKVWNSAEDILDGSIQPKRPERRRKLKGKAPQPPTKPEENVLSGQYVRVNVNFDILKDENNRLVFKSNKEPHPKKLQHFSLLSTKNNLTGFLKPKPISLYPETIKRVQNGGKNNTNINNMADKSLWMNSVPRLLKKPRSKSETRINNTPMAYRYIDTTQSYPVTFGLQNLNQKSLGYSNYNSIQRGKSSNNSPNLNHNSNNSPNINNRLFGLSQKLKDFAEEGKSEEKWRTENNNLKSVIKKDENRKKNEKKVTFSAYNTVQVV